MKDELKLSDLNPSVYNPRKIDEVSFEGLKFSLTEFGDISGITFNLRTNNLVTGHQRVRGLKEKFEDIRITKLNEDWGIIKTPDGNEYKVRFVNWDPKKEKAANVAANAETIQGDWDESAALLIEEISLELPEFAKALNLNALDLPLIDFPVESLELGRSYSDIPQEQRNILKFGERVIYLSEEEFEGLNKTFSVYFEKNKNSYGFITYLLEGKK